MPKSSGEMVSEPISLKSKLPGIGDSVFAVMTRKAQSHGALNLSQGFPDFETPKALIDRVYHYMQAGKNQYVPMPGIAGLREAIATKMADLYQTAFSAEDEITVTAGATQGLYAALSAVVDHKDEVIVIEPAYDAYIPTIKMSKGRPIYVEATYPDFRFPIQEIKKVLNYNTRAILLNNPHNPSGAVLREQDLKELAKITRGTDIVLISDEVYEHLYFDGREHLSLCCHPELRNRSISIFSFGKTYHNTGWKMGYTIAPPLLTREVRKVHQFMMFCVFGPAQYAFADILNQKLLYPELSAFYQHKRDLLVEALKGSRFRALPCEAGFFLNLDYSSITRRSDVNFADELIRNHGIATIPNSAFYHDKDDYKSLRLCFAKDDQTLLKAAEMLCKI